jgi:hypothetical protein
MNNDNDCNLRDEDGAPNVRALAAELKATCDGASGVYEQMLMDENTRRAKWADQSDTGRKPELVGGKPARPWGGSSDVRIRLADELVVEDIRLMKMAHRTGRLMVRGTEGTDAGEASKVQIYLDHLKNTKLRAELKLELELAAQYRQSFGYALTAITWHQEWARAYEEVTLEDLAELAAPTPENPQGVPAVAAMLQLLASPDRDDLKDLASQLVQMYPDLDRGEAYRQVQALRTEGKMSLPVRELRVNRPRWEALKLWRDAFIPLNTGAIQRTRWFCWRETLTEAEVDERKLSAGWSEEFAAAVKKTKGKTVLEGVLQRMTETERRQIFTDSAEEMAGLCEVFSFYYRHADEDGVPCLYRTEISPHLGKSKSDPEQDLHGRDGPLGYEHGLYPVIEHRRERPDRMMVESRSTPAIVATNQAEVKWMRDGRIDQNDLGLRPPVIRPEREVGLPLTIKPMGEIGERRQKSLSFLTVPQIPSHSEPLEAEARRDAERYFARNRGEDPAGAALADQDLAADWCEELAEGWAMTLALAQQFQGDLVFNRIVGGQPQRFSISRQEIQGQFDLQVFFNPDQLDEKKQQAKTDRLQKVYVPLDRFGVIDLGPIIRGLVGYDFPEFADAALRGVEQATAAELADEQNNWGLILAGTEPKMVEQGQNFQLRLDWLENQLALPGAQARLGALPDSQILVKRRIDHLNFQIQQQQNADTGRTGVPPLDPAELGAAVTGVAPAA